MDDLIKYFKSLEDRISTLEEALGIDPKDWEAKARRMIREGANPIAVLKVYKDGTGCTLREAKDFVDRIWAK